MLHFRFTVGTSICSWRQLLFPPAPHELTLIYSIRDEPVLKAAVYAAAYCKALGIKYVKLTSMDNIGFCSRCSGGSCNVLSLISLLEAYRSPQCSNTQTDYILFFAGRKNEPLHKKNNNNNLHRQLCHVLFRLLMSKNGKQACSPASM